MGFLPMVAGAFVVLVVNVVCAAFTGWVLKFVREKAKKLLATERGTVRNNREVLCPCVFGRFSTVQFTLGVTKTSVASFLGHDLSKVLAMVVYLATCFHCGKGVTQTQKWFNVVQLFFLCGGYGIMLVTHFERLRLTFKGTSHEIPEWAPNVLYAVIGMGISFLIGDGIFLYTLPIVSAVFVALEILMYFCCSAALVRAFFKRTMAIATSTEMRSEVLVQTATRVTVSVGVSLLSSSLCFVFFSLAVVCCPMCVFWMVARDVIITLDMTINAFCLMCTLRDATPFYLAVFGRLHSLMLARIAAEHSGAKPQLETVVSITEINSQNEDTVNTKTQDTAKMEDTVTTQMEDTVTTQTDLLSLSQTDAD